MSDARGHTGIDRKDQQKHQQQTHHDAALETALDTLLQICRSASIVIKEKPASAYGNTGNTTRYLEGFSGGL